MEFGPDSEQTGPVEDLDEDASSLRATRSVWQYLQSPCVCACVIRFQVIVNSRPAGGGLVAPSPPCGLHMESSWEEDLTIHCALNLLRIITFPLPAAALEAGLWWEYTVLFGR